MVTIRYSLNDPQLDTTDLYAAYLGKLDHILNAKYVFEQVAHIPNSDRHFEFASFSAHILFVLCKLGLAELYDGDALLPIDLPQWNELIITKILLYLLNTINVDTKSFRDINVNNTNSPKRGRMIVGGNGDECSLQSGGGGVCSGKERKGQRRRITMSAIKSRAYIISEEGTYKTAMIKSNGDGI